MLTHLHIGYLVPAFLVMGSSCSDTLTYGTQPAGSAGGHAAPPSTTRGRGKRREGKDESGQEDKTGRKEKGGGGSDLRCLSAAPGGGPHYQISVVTRRPLTRRWGRRHRRGDGHMRHQDPSRGRTGRHGHSGSHNNHRQLFGGKGGFSCVGFGLPVPGTRHNTHGVPFRRHWAS